jgi:hypothetical protein
MARAPKSLTPIEAFLAPVAALALGSPDLEGQVLWYRDGQWSDGAGEMLEAEEIAFYAEGLLLEGFSLHWDHLSSPVLGMELIRLCFWQGEAAMVPPPPAGWQVQAQDRFTAR